MEGNSWTGWAKQAGFGVIAKVSRTGAALKDKVGSLQPIHSFKRSFSASIAYAKASKQRLTSSLKDKYAQLNARLQELKTPKDPVDRAVRYRRYILQIPLQVRLGFIAWSAGLMCYATTGFRARLRRTGLLTGVLGLVLTPDFRPWRGKD